MCFDLGVLGEPSSSPSNQSQGTFLEQQEGRGALFEGHEFMCLWGPYCQGGGEGVPNIKESHYYV